MTMQSKPLGRPVNVAVVGLGFMGVTHLRGYLQHPHARIAAVCDPVRRPVNGVLAGVAGNIKKSEGLRLPEHTQVCTSISEVLENPVIDLVDLCTPTPQHPEQAMAALRAGKHVLCEKPIARTAAIAEEICKTAAASPGFFMPAMCMRFWPGWDSLKEAVSNQTHGRVLAARFRRVSEMPTWSRQGTYSQATDTGGALFDLHIHDTDFVHYLFGRPGRVYSTGVVAPSGSIDHVLTQYTFPSGPTVSAEGSWLLNRGFQMEFTLLCERATLDYNSSRGPAALQVTRDGGEPVPVNLPAADGYTGEIEYMIDCIRRGIPPQRVTARDALEVLEICQAEEQSVRSTQAVELPNRQV